MEQDKEKGADAPQPDEKDLRIAELENQLADAQALIEEQHKALTAVSSAVADTDAVMVTVDKKKYKVVVPKFRYDGKDYEATDLKTNARLAAKLVELGSAVLVPVK